MFNVPGDEWKSKVDNDARPKHICPTCADEGRKSQLFFTDVQKDENLPTIRFYDEEGEFHYHAPLRYTYYWCSNNHLVRQEMASYVCIACVKDMEEQERAYDNFALRHVTSPEEIEMCSKEPTTLRVNNILSAYGFKWGGNF
jgi:hypothetical protein